MLIYPDAKESGLDQYGQGLAAFEKAELPSFRHYQWSSMETSFGYGQDWKWVEKITDHPVDKLIRRPTGGGIVKHGEDWTYCLVIPRVHNAFSMPPLDLYKEVHLCISSALAKQDLMTTLQPCPKEKGKIIPGLFRRARGLGPYEFWFIKKGSRSCNEEISKRSLTSGNHYHGQIMEAQ